MPDRRPEEPPDSSARDRGIGWGWLALVCCLLSVPLEFILVGNARSLDGPDPRAFLTMPFILLCLGIHGLGTLLAFMGLAVGQRNTRPSLAALGISVIGGIYVFLV